MPVNTDIFVQDPPDRPRTRRSTSAFFAVALHCARKIMLLAIAKHTRTLLPPGNENRATKNLWADQPNKLPPAEKPDDQETWADKPNSEFW